MKVETSEVYLSIHTEVTVKDALDHHEESLKLLDNLKLEAGGSKAKTKKTSGLPRWSSSDCKIELLLPCKTCQTNTENDVGTTVRDIIYQLEVRCTDCKKKKCCSVSSHQVPQIPNIE